MEEKFKNIKFNMTKEMSESLANFFNLKMKLELLKKILLNLMMIYKAKKEKLMTK